MNLLTSSQHKEILDNHPSDHNAALAYTMRLGVPVQRQNVTYWRRIFSDGIKRKHKADTQIIEKSRVLRTPSPEDDIGCTSWIPYTSRTTLVIGDLHCPYWHCDALRFLSDIKDKWNPDVCVQIGDETDGHALSFHESDPNLDSAGVELERAKAQLNGLHSVFPNLLICHSNHGSLIYRRAKWAGIPVQAIKTYREILFPAHGAPNWSWASSWTINTENGPVLFRHEAGNADILNAAAAEGCNVVAGHEHSKFGSSHGATSMRLFFGAYTGCLVDKDSMAFAYGKVYPRKPILGALIIKDGIPINIPMVLDNNGRWVGE